MEVKIDEAVLRELYLPAFYAALKKGGAYTVMGAYNKLYGEHCCQSEFLLKQILRTEWEYDRVVISDWGRFTTPRRRQTPSWISKCLSPRILMRILWQPP